MSHHTQPSSQTSHKPYWTHIPNRHVTVTSEEFKRTNCALGSCCIFLDNCALAFSLATPFCHSMGKPAVRPRHVPSMNASRPPAPSMPLDVLSIRAHPARTPRPALAVHGPTGLGKITRITILLYHTLRPPSLRTEIGGWVEIPVYR